MPPTRNFKGEKMTLTVNLGDASYDIVLERGCLDRAAEHLDLCRRVLVVTDAGVPKAYAERLAAQCRAPRIVIVPEGESSKSVEGWTLLLREMLDGGYDYWFSVDTDIVLDPWTLYRLLEADKDIVSEIFWTQAPNGKYWCNAWMVDQSCGMPEEWKKPGLYRCGMTGALTLVKRKVFEAGVSYEKIPNIHSALRGEDRHFCVRAACHGFEMWIDTHCPARHLYTRRLYEEYMAERR